MYYGNTAESEHQIPKVNNIFRIEIICFQCAAVTAQTQKNQSSRLASLFGLDEFERFVNEFTSDISQYLVKKVDAEKTISEWENKNESDRCGLYKNIESYRK